MTKDPIEPKFFMPPNTIKKKVGDGGIPANLLSKAQKHLDDNTEEFSPYALELLESLKEAMQEAKTAKTDQQNSRLIQKFSASVMPLKANGSMFHYELVTEVSDIVMKFLDQIDVINADLMNILHAYNQTISIILSKEQTGDGGALGRTLSEEMRKAIARYFAKYGQ